MLDDKVISVQLALPHITRNIMNHSIHSRLVTWFVAEASHDSTP